MTEDELAKLYTAFGYFLFRRCVVYLGDPSAAEAALLEVFVEFAQNAAATGDPRARLCRIADRLCVDTLQRHARDNAPAHEPDADAIAAAIGDDESESLLIVRRLLREVEPRSLRLAVLYYVDELTEEELARELGLPRRTVQKRVQALLGRARTLLRAEHAP